ncbi:hypothetical protein OG613_04755 [Streptomyces sp. NBC_00015]|uniref:hypothetical protein n=1 Tax=Streptomyces sp. NBC_00015 TaxID=2903611 RepID=UPI00324B5F12
MPHARPVMSPASPAAVEREQARTGVVHPGARARQHGHPAGMAGVPLYRAADAMPRRIADLDPPRARGSSPGYRRTGPPMSPAGCSCC